MIDDLSILAIVPARAGSKGIINKNIKDVAGKPLIAWTILEAKKSRYIDRLIVSSEDSEIISVAKRWGCEAPFVRPAELAKDDTPGVEPVLHAIDNLPRYDYVVLLQPTSPLRVATDIDNCIELCLERSAPVCVSITEARKAPYLMYSLREGGGIVPIINSEKRYTRRQDYPKTYEVNGAVYVARLDWLKENKEFLLEKTIGYVMPRGRSLDVDTEMDLLIADFMLRRGEEN